MNADSSSSNPSGKQVTLAGCVVWIFNLLRMFWLTELTLLLVVLYGLRAGWSTPPQWNNGLFFCSVLVLDSLRRMKFGLRAFWGGVLTMLIAALVLWV